MAFHIKDKETDALVRELARRKKVGLTAAVKLAVRHELEGERAKKPFREVAREIAEKIAQYPKTGQKADKAFFDELSGD